MNVGTKSLLLGAHWPPHVVLVTLAWRWLYGSWPSLRELAAIVLHDIGYAGCREMDGEDGTRHPELGARVADLWLGEDCGALIRGHSKGYAELAGVPLSKLYAPDKLSIVFEPARFYAWRTRLTGELGQYRAVSHGGAPRADNAAVSDREWFRVIRMRMARGGLSHAISVAAPDGLGSHRGR